LVGAQHKLLILVYISLEGKENGLSETTAKIIVRQIHFPLKSHTSSLRAVLVHTELEDYGRQLLGSDGD
jgi:hypothetical protein